jgi:SsrA-binding protein
MAKHGQSVARLSTKQRYNRPMSLVVNKKAFHDYEIKDSFYAGVALTGPEVKSLRGRHASLTGSYVKVVSGELFLLGAMISPYAYADNRDYDPIRTRKLLVAKKELLKLQQQHDQQKVSLIPLSFELGGRFIKLKVGIGRGKKQYQHRQALKERDLKRAAAAEVKQRIRIS